MNAQRFLGLTGQVGVSSLWEEATWAATPVVAGGAGINVINMNPRRMVIDWAMVFQIGGGFRNTKPKAEYTLLLNINEVRSLTRYIGVKFPVRFGIIRKRFMFSAGPEINLLLGATEKYSVYDKNYTESAVYFLPDPGISTRFAFNIKRDNGGKALLVPAIEIGTHFISRDIYAMVSLTIGRLRQKNTPTQAPPDRVTP